MTEPVEDPYAVLGVPRDATADEIRRAYEKKLNAASAAGALNVAQRLHKAFSVLNDRHTREIYDRDGRIVELPRLAPDLRWASPERVADQPRRQPGRERVRRALGGTVKMSVALVLVLAVVGVGLKFGLLRDSATGSSPTNPNDVWRAASTTPSLFPVHHAVHRNRLLATVAAPAGSAPYAFAELGPDNSPVRWDPCTPIRYVISGNEPFPGAAVMLTSAINEVSADTGLQFVYAGTSTETPSHKRPSYQPSRYGDKWAPALIAWSDPSVLSDLAGSIVGIGGGGGATIDGQARIVSGQVAYDGPDLARMVQRPNGRVEARSVMLHELGHLVGLNHVHDPTQIMNPTAHPIAHFAAGDRRGLAILGAGACPTSY